MFQTFDVTARPQDAPPRVARLRAWMAEQGLDAFIVPRADAHQGEYVAPCDARLAWISGFTGSAGFAVILAGRAALFVDGRYTVQAKAQTDPATFERVAWPDTSLAAWLKSALPQGGRVGFDPWLHTVAEMEKLRGLDGIALEPVANGVDAVWEDRPAPPMGAMRAYPDALAGRAHAEKRAQIAEALRAAGVAAFVTTQPDAIAWLLNIRGADIERTPIAQAFAVIHADATVDLICAPEKTTPVADHLGDAVRVVPSEQLPTLLAGIEGAVGYDKTTCPVALAEMPGEARAMDDPLALPKACKTEAEIDATREAHLRDGAAMVRFLRWLDEDRPDDLTEIGVAQALEGFRRDTNQLLEISFETIAGAGPNAALPHYRVNVETDRPIAGEPVLLVDSGGQYLDGTTDITRTVPVAAPDPEVAHHFTRVLQGMIAVSRARFPKGVAGCHLDALARAPLWAEHKDYDHGTGHGVGVYLGVHEGPQRISRVSQVPLAPGMILSNEPGYYREGAFGIRIENLIVVREAERPAGGDDRKMLDFETLTWVPIDRRLIAAELLSPDERAWLDAYHAEVAARIGPRVEGADRDWLLRMTAPLGS
ncbi:aminopeptidase P family protein [Jannaschia seohaensis]|uniref:Xaa-Pro aminopeptidase n=1 Tax=Jannaschia seohaensis TaxID=475081 RepID=A0A2Y9B2I0_9RHOB|nr:aminopeptidase P family protein [Jannaschia seohaensis]PWJ13330.1 Xaa-Pro aminopeptidase [Jannaschia seohaensis]SSA50656.1 Xaa-Pro aminopeptidase [Jannaschia seohaensis]